MEGHAMSDFLGGGGGGLIVWEAGAGYDSCGEIGAGCGMVVGTDPFRNEIVG